MRAIDETEQVFGMWKNDLPLLGRVSDGSISLGEGEREPYVKPGYGGKFIYT